MQIYFNMRRPAIEFVSLSYFSTSLKGAGYEGYNRKNVMRTENMTSFGERVDCAQKPKISMSTPPGPFPPRKVQQSEF